MNGAGAGRGASDPRGAAHERTGLAWSRSLLLVVVTGAVLGRAAAEAGSTLLGVLVACCLVAAAGTVAAMGAGDRPPGETARRARDVRVLTAVTVLAGLLALGVTAALAR